MVSLRSPGLILLLLGSVAGLTTVSLLDARLRLSPSSGVPVKAPTAAEPVTPQPSIPFAEGVVSAGHPLLPERFAGLEDELLSSPMLHHPPFAREVERWVGFWSVNFSDWMPAYLERMTGFETMVDATLADHALPWSLRYLPVIESGYSTSAVSSASAVGMWQFMAGTARDLGVEVGPIVDDRRDPFVSTGAAADYLLQLRNDFGSWYLALAAYNAGPDRINGIMARYLPDIEPSDAVYWALRDVLPNETADFVPNLIGAIIVASDPVAHGYGAPNPTPFEFDSVPVRGSISFETIARATGVTAEEIARLNPEYVRGVTPREREVVLRVPLGRADAFRSYFSGDTQ